MAEIVGRDHADGIYLALPHEAHIADTALGYSGMKDVFNSPPEWWWESPFNTLVPRKPDTDDQKRWAIVGEAIHVAFLDSLTKFDTAFGTMPSLLDCPEALSGQRELQAMCRRLGLKASGTMEELADRITEFDPTIPILLHIQDAWADLGKRGLTFTEYAVIKLLHRMMSRSPDEIELAGGERMSLAEGFAGGLSEVSVFWTDENGVRMRARFDKLKVNSTIDLKSIGRPIRNFREALLREIANRGYMFQAVHYNEARRQLPRLIAEGKVFGGTPAEHAYLKDCADQEEWGWVFVFAKTVGAPQVKGIRIDEHDTVYINAKRDRDDALLNFLHYREIFGLEPGVQWFDPQVIWKPEDTDWPMFAGVE